MDSIIKSKCLEKEKFAKDKDLSFHWEHQRRMWKNQRESIFSVLFDEKVIDTSSNNVSKANKDDKIIEPQSSKDKVKYEKFISCITKKEIGQSTESIVEAKPSFQNVTMEYNKHADNGKLKPNLIDNIFVKDTIKQDPIFTTQKSDIKSTVKIPMHKFSPVDSNMFSPPKNSDNCFVNLNETLKKIGIEENSTFPQPPSAIIKCHVCNQQVSKCELALHLFFGPLGCDDCHINFFDCRSFHSDHYIAPNCFHNQLSWLEDPVQYLISALNETPMYDNENIHHYIESLKTLEQLSPWKTAFQEYHIFKKMNFLPNINGELDKNKFEGEIDYVNKSICDEILLFESYDIHQMEHDIQVVGLVDNEMFEENFTEVLSKTKLYKERQTVEFKQNKRIKNMFDFDITINKCNDNSDTEQIHLEKKTSYKNKMPTNDSDNIDQISKRAKYLKTKCYERRKEKNNLVFKNTNKFIESISHVMDDEVKYTLSNDYQIEFLDLPKDGNYLVSDTPIEECPMCYTVLSLYKCVVNIKLLLYTFSCQCGLKIFYMPKTPSNINHPVKIIEF